MAEPPEEPEVWVVDRSVVLERSFGPEGSRSADARLTAEGDLLIEVQDLGAQVRAYWGPDVAEYEFAWTIRPGDVAALVEALGAAPGADVLRLLSERFSNVGELERFIRERDIRAEFWSRVGN